MVAEVQHRSKFQLPTMWEISKKAFTILDSIKKWFDFNGDYKFQILYYVVIVFMTLCLEFLA